MNRLDEYTRLHVLEQIAERTVLEELEHIVVAVVNRERDDLCPRARLLKLLRNVKSGKSGHVDIEKEDIRFQHERSRESFLPVFCLADDLEIILEVQHALNPLPQQCVIICK